MPYLCTHLYYTMWKQKKKLLYKVFCHLQQILGQIDNNNEFQQQNIKHFAIHMKKTIINDDHDTCARTLYARNHQKNMIVI